MTTPKASIIVKIEHEMFVHIRVLPAASKKEIPKNENDIIGDDRYWYRYRITIINMGSHLLLLCCQTTFVKLHNMYK